MATCADVKKPKASAAPVGAELALQLTNLPFQLIDQIAAVRLDGNRPGHDALELIH